MERESLNEAFFALDLFLVAVGSGRRGPGNLALGRWGSGDGPGGGRPLVQPWADDHGEVRAFHRRSTGLCRMFSWSLGSTPSNFWKRAAGAGWMLRPLPPNSVRHMTVQCVFVPWHPIIPSCVGQSVQQCLNQSCERKGSPRWTGLGGCVICNGTSPAALRCGISHPRPSKFVAWRCSTRLGS